MSGRDKPPGPHEQVRDELVRVIRTGGTWSDNVSTKNAGGKPGVDTRPLTYPSAGSQNWNNMAWVGEGLGKKGYGAIDMWHRCAAGVEPESNSIGLFNTEVGSSIYCRWTAASTFLAAVPDQRGKCAVPPDNTQDMARRANGAYAAFFTLHAMNAFRKKVRSFLHKDENLEDIEPDQPLPWVVAAQNRGVAKNNAARWPHCSNPNGWWLALALDWPGRPRVVPKAESADWWLWAMQEISGKKYHETWPAEWFGLTEDDRSDLRQFIESDGREHKDTLLRLASIGKVRRKYCVKRWNGRLISWMPASSNGNNPAVLAAEWFKQQVWVYAPSRFFKGPRKSIFPGEARDDEQERRVICKGDDGVELRSNVYPGTRPTVNAVWTQKQGLKLLGLR